jgi:predicted metalloenzyme YecM
MDGYICDSFTISHLATPPPSRKKEGEDNNTNDGSPPTSLQLCDNLIQQAIELTNLSKDTFWIPADDDDDNDNGEYCELELLARKIYRHHKSYYSLSSGVEGGAEWWVQVKHPTTTTNSSSSSSSSSSKSIVDLHYDKDEVLAEIFGLGSFPTLSTVTYLTDTIDNVPTIIFPHTYHDDEERTIGSMALSIPKMGKHVVFDGQLLHGAPYHSSLLRPHTTTTTTDTGNNIGSEGGGMNNNNNDDNNNLSSSSLRVTFLVNIWTCRKPSNVHVLPNSIRNILISSHHSTNNANKMSSLFRRVIPLLTFEPRIIRNITIPPVGIQGRRGRGPLLTEYDGQCIYTAAKDGDKVGGNKAAALSFDWTQPTKKRALDKIILPFVSKGATWIDDDTSNDNVVNNVKEGDDIDMIDDEEEEGGDEKMQDDVNDNDDTGSEEEDEESDEEDDLFLLLSPLFATDEYMYDNTADTFIFNFDDDNCAQLVRGEELREMGYNIYFNNNNNDGDNNNKNKVIAQQFFSDLRTQVPLFVSSIITNLGNQYGMDVTNYQADHVCYRTETVYEYNRLVKALKADTNNIHLLVESEIGGRSIATFKLTMPIEIINPCITAGDIGSTRLIDVIEIPSPKVGSPYISGLEHVEFVIGNRLLINNYSPINDNHHQSTLQAWMDTFPSVSWNIKALNKYCNPDVSTTLNLPDGKEVSVKFHLLPLEDVIKFEETM